MSPYRAWPFLADPRHADLTAASAVLIHGLIGILVLAPILVRSRRPFLFAALAFVGGVAVDLDHVVAAGSASPHAMEHLGDRPETHSLLLALALALVVLVVVRSTLLAWCVFAVFASHVLFDAAGGADRWLYPLSSSAALPWLICPASLVAFIAASFALARRLPPGAGVLSPARAPSPPASARGTVSPGSAGPASRRRRRRRARGRTGARTATPRPAEDPPA